MDGVYWVRFAERGLLGLVYWVCLDRFSGSGLLGLSGWVSWVGFTGSGLLGQVC